MQSKRAEILSLYANTELLESGARKRTYRFIEEFFEILDDPERVAKEIVSRCRGEEELEKMLASD